MQFKALTKSWDNLVAPWLQRIHSYPFPVIELRGDMPLAAICHIFEKVNSTGVPLNVFDLCTAILWSQGLWLNELWSETTKKFRDQQVLRMQSGIGQPDGAGFLQSIALIDSMSRKRADADSRIAVSCRRDDLLALRAETVRRWWPVVADAYRGASKFMEANGIVSSRILPYTTMIIPLAAMFGYIASHHGSVHVGYAWPKIQRWYWCAIFSQRYSSSVGGGSRAGAELDR